MITPGKLNKEAAPTCNFTQYWPNAWAPLLSEVWKQTKVSSCPRGGV